MCLCARVYALKERLREIEEELVRQEAIRRAEEAYEAKLLDQQRRMEEAQTRIRAEEEKRRRIQEKLRQISPCPAGFNWFQCGGGWRCGGGSHFVSNAELERQFTS
jgi:hypothetical protein